jgi:putative methyltransferase (TIGR04325 family)
MNAPLTMNRPLPHAIRAIASRLARPALRQLKRRQFFSEKGFGDCFGVFEDFDAARAWLPRSVEFDLAALTQEYVEVRTRQVFAYDYPVMWWLERAFRAGAASVLDIGGSVGVHYYAYRNYFEMPGRLTWRIAEVPAVVAVGRNLAARNHADALSFTDDLELSDKNVDVWLSAGALQYVENGRPDRLLEASGARPRHILLNKLPLYGGKDFVTAQNIGKGCYAPVHVYNRLRFVRSIEAFGYALKDHWLVPERSLHVPGHPERSFPAFSGLYFVRS